MNGFLPDDYTPPETSGKYMKFKLGENRFRILSPKALIGYVGWTERIENGKKLRQPVRKRTGESWQLGEVERDRVRHFLAFAIYNYAEKRVQVLEITQSGIIKSLHALTKDSDYGDPRGYDVTVTRRGEGMDTEYTVLPKPPRPVAEEVSAQWTELQRDGFDISRLLSNGDPFGSPVTSGVHIATDTPDYDERNPPPEDSDIPL